MINYHATSILGLPIVCLIIHGIISHTLSTFLKLARNWLFIPDSLTFIEFPILNFSLLMFLPFLPYYLLHWLTHKSFYTKLGRDALWEMIWYDLALHHRKRLLSHGCMVLPWGCFIIIKCNIELTNVTKLVTLVRLFILLIVKIGQNWGKSQ